MHSLGESMPGTWDQPKQLRGGVKEIQDLRDEEEQQCLTEMAQDTHHGKCHASKIAISVPHKHTRWVPGWGGGGTVVSRKRGMGGTDCSPVVFEQGEGHSYEGDDKVERKGMLTALRTTQFH